MKKNLLFLCVMFLMLVLTGCKPSEEKTLQGYLDKITIETEVDGDFYLPRAIDNKEDHTISWTSSDAKTIKIGNLAEINGAQCYTANVKRSNEDKEVVLTATVEMASGLSMEKEFKVTVKADLDKPIFSEWPYEENKAYKFTLHHTNPKVNKDLYFTGEMNGFYLATSEYSGDGVDVFTEKVEGGYKLFFKKGEVKNYLAIEKAKGTDGKEHTNAVFGADKNCVFTWKADYQTFTTKIGELDAYFGTDAAKTYTTIGVRTGLKIEENCVVTLTTPEIVPNPTPTPTPTPDDKNWGVVETFEAGKAYKFGLNQTSKGQTLYITGGIKEATPWYLPTTDDKAAAADVTAVKVEGGYNLKVEGTAGVKYINAKQDGTHYSIFLEDAAASTWRYDETHHTFIAQCGDKEVFIGTHDTYTTFSANTLDKIETSMIAHFYGKVDGSKPNPDPQPQPQPTEWPYAEGKAYKFTLVHTNPAVVDKTVYFTGAMQGFYFATSANLAEGVDVFVEKVEGGYKLYFMAGEVKNYIAIEKAMGGDGKEHVNAVFGADKVSVFTWDATLGTMVTKIGDKNYYFGTRSDKTYTTIGTSSNTTAGASCVVTLTEAGTTPTPKPDPEPQPEAKPQIGEWPYETNKAYKLTMVHTNPAVNKTYYFTGDMAGWYFGTSTYAIKGADIYCEQVEGGYKLYFTDAKNVKNYLGIVISDDGQHINAKFGPDYINVFVWDTNLKTMITKVGEKYCYFGTDATKNYGTIGGCDSFKVGDSCVVTLTTPELVPLPVVKENLITVDTLGIAGQGYGNGTANINNVDYEYVEVCDTGKGVQMRSKNGKSSVIKNTTALSASIQEIKFVLNEKEIYKDITDALTIELLDEKGTVLETFKLNFAKGTAEYTFTSTVDAKFFKISHTCKNAIYANSILVTTKPAA